MISKISVIVLFLIAIFNIVYGITSNNDDIINRGILLAIPFILPLYHNNIIKKG